jgi:hypothetical protein
LLDSEALRNALGFGPSWLSFDPMYSTQPHLLFCILLFFSSMYSTL